MKTKDDFVFGAKCSVNKSKGILTGYMEWGGKLQYVWVRFGETCELVRPQKVKLV